MTKWMVLIVSLILGITGIQASVSLSPASQWWRVYNDSALNHLVDGVLAQNLDIRAAKQRVEDAQALSQVPRATQWPEFALVANTTWSNFTLNRDSVVSNIGIQAAWDLDFFGGKNAQINRADALVEARYAELASVKKRLVQELVLAVIAYRETQLVQSLATAQVDELDRQMKSLNDQVKAGLVSDMPVLEAKIRRAEVAASLPSLAASLAVAERQVSQLMGATSDAVIAPLREVQVKEIVAPGVEVALDVPLHAIQARPDVALAQSLIKTAGADVAEAEAALWPTVRLSAFGGLQDATAGFFQSEDGVWRVNGVVNWPLFNFGRLQSLTSAADSKKRAALNGYEATVVRAVQEVLANASFYAAASETLGVNAELLALNRKLADRLETQAKAGLVADPIVSTQRLAVLASRQSMVRQQARVASAYAQLQSALGAGI